MRATVPAIDEDATASEADGWSMLAEKMDIGSAKGDPVAWARRHFDCEGTELICKSHQRGPGIGIDLLLGMGDRLAQSQHALDAWHRHVCPVVGGEERALEYLGSKLICIDHHQLKFEWDSFADDALARLSACKDETEAPAALFGSLRAVERQFAFDQQVGLVECGGGEGLANWFLYPDMPTMRDMLGGMETVRSIDLLNDRLNDYIEHRARALDTHAPDEIEQMPADALGDAADPALIRAERVWCSVYTAYRAVALALGKPDYQTRNGKVWREKCGRLADAYILDAYDAMDGYRTMRDLVSDILKSRRWAAPAPDISDDVANQTAMRLFIDSQWEITRSIDIKTRTVESKPPVSDIDSRMELLSRGTRKI
jgi:hypothetical protein